MSIFNSKTKKQRRASILGTFSKCVQDLTQLNVEINTENAQKQKEIDQLTKQVEENKVLLNENGKSIAKIKEIIG